MMAWLRLDDGFTKHPKLAGWTAAQKWAWLEVMEYCARYQTGGRIPEDLSVMPRTTTPALLQRAEDAGLLDRSDDGGKVIHDWPIYNGQTVEEKVAYCLARHPDASANEIHKTVGGKREIVLSEVARQRPEPGSQNGTHAGTQEPQREPVDTGTQGTTYPVPEPVPKLVHARALPSRPLKKEPKAVALRTPEDHPDPEDETAPGETHQDLIHIIPNLPEIP